MPLSPDQQEAVNKISAFLNTPEATEYILSGSPGTGKSYVTSEILEVAKKLNYITICSATTHAAVKVLQDMSGDLAYTIHNVLDLRVQTDYVKDKTYLVKKPKKSFWRTSKFVKNFLIIDEASYIDKELDVFIQELITDKNIKILYVGDRNQLPPVNSTIPYIFTKNIPTSYLTTNHRFDENSEINRICNELKFEIENTSYYIPPIQTAAEIEVLDGEEFQTKLEQYYTSIEYDVDPYFCKTVAYRNTIVDGLNDLVRGFLGYKKEFEIGEKVVLTSPYLMNAATNWFTINNGEIVEILDIEDGEFYDIKGKNFTIKYLDNEWENIFYTPHVRLISKKKKELLAEKKYKEVDAFLSAILRIKPLYASTIHKAQGSSYDNIFIHLDDLFVCKDAALLPRLLYVALSRAKEKVFIYGEVPNKFHRKK